MTKRPRTKQIYLGRVDPVTKEIFPKGENGKRNRIKQSDQLDELQKQVIANQRTIMEANEAIEVLQERLGKADKFFEDLKGIVSRYEEESKPDHKPLESSGSGGDE